MVNLVQLVRQAEKNDLDRLYPELAEVVVSLDRKACASNAIYIRSLIDDLARFHRFSINPISVRRGCMEVLLRFNVVPEARRFFELADSEGLQYFAYKHRLLFLEFHESILSSRLYFEDVK